MTTKGKSENKHSHDSLNHNLCVFCEHGNENEEVYGKLMRKAGITTHYFCMLFSSGLCQNGKSEKVGVLGFLPVDIMKEVSRAHRLKCSFCKKKGATIGCVIKNCRSMFHFGCGRQNETLHQFFDTFSSYCPEHRPRQEVPAGVTDTSGVCSICMTAVQTRPANDTLCTPCCRRSWYHRDCIQRYAMSAGLYFFKCPLCNNKDEFQAEMLQYGIYIPDQDASWETEPHAFQDLLEQYHHCDAKICRCAEGRDYDKEKSKWELIVCNLCGSSGSHIGCHYLKKIGKNNFCPDCAELDKKYKTDVHQSPKAKPKAKKKACSSPEGPSSSTQKLSDKQASAYPGPSRRLLKKGLPVEVDFVGSPQSRQSRKRSLGDERSGQRRRSKSVGSETAKKRRLSTATSQPHSANCRTSGSAGRSKQVRWEDASSSDSDSEDEMCYQKAKSLQESCHGNQPSGSKKTSKASADRNWMWLSKKRKNRRQGLAGLRGYVTDDSDFEFEEENARHTSSKGKSYGGSSGKKGLTSGNDIGTRKQDQMKSKLREAAPTLSSLFALKHKGNGPTKQKKEKCSLPGKSGQQPTLARWLKADSKTQTLTAVKGKQEVPQNKYSCFEWKGQQLLIKSPKVLLTRCSSKAKRSLRSAKDVSVCEVGLDDIDLRLTRNMVNTPEKVESLLTDPSVPLAQSVTPIKLPSPTKRTEIDSPKEVHTPRSDCRKANKLSISHALSPTQNSETGRSRSLTLPSSPRQDSDVRLGKHRSLSVTPASSPAHGKQESVKPTQPLSSTKTAIVDERQPSQVSEVSSSIAETEKQQAVIIKASMSPKLRTDIDKGQCQSSPWKLRSLKQASPGLYSAREDLPLQSINHKDVRVTRNMTNAIDDVESLVRDSFMSVMQSSTPARREEIENYQSSPAASDFLDSDRSKQWGQVLGLDCTIDKQQSSTGKAQARDKKELCTEAVESGYSMKQQQKQVTENTDKSGVRITRSRTPNLPTRIRPRKMSDSDSKLIERLISESILRGEKKAKTASVKNETAQIRQSPEKITTEDLGSLTCEKAKRSLSNRFDAAREENDNHTTRFTKIKEHVTVGTSLSVSPQKSLLKLQTERKVPCLEDITEPRSPSQCTRSSSRVASDIKATMVLPPDFPLPQREHAETHGPKSNDFPATLTDSHDKILYQKVVVSPPRGSDVLDHDDGYPIFPTPADSPCRLQLPRSVSRSSDLSDVSYTSLNSLSPGFITKFTRSQSNLSDTSSTSAGTDCQQCLSPRRMSTRGQPASCVEPPCPYSSMPATTIVEQYQSLTEACGSELPVELAMSPGKSASQAGLMFSQYYESSMVAASVTEKILI